MDEDKGLDGRRPMLRAMPFFAKSEQATIPSGVHTGLWIDKFLPHQEKGAGDVKADHFACSVRPVDQLYKEFYARWEKSLAELGAQTCRARVLGRLSIGLGGESVLETSITLHHTYGVPYIPGSALKGLAASYARRRLDKWTPDHSEVLFGDTDAAGYVTFFDALYIPDTTQANSALALDVMNVHYPDYYRGTKDAAPADWDSPTPVSFLSAVGSYLIAVQGPEEWVKAAFEILGYALKEEGIGAKTSSGYGRMEIEGAAGQPPQAEEMAQVTAPVAPTQPARPTRIRKGVIVKIVSAARGFGFVRDEEDNREYRFPISVIQGETPGKKQQVEFELDGDKVVKVRRA